MKKSYLLIIIVLFMLLVAWNISGFETLEEAVQNQWKTPIDVINHDAEKQVVYYLDQDQHVIGTYKYKNGKYFYDNKHSEGMRFSAEKGIPFYISYSHFKEAGDIVYGAIKSENYVVDKFVIQYKNGEKQEIKAKNNSFLAEVPFNMDSNDFMNKIRAAHGLDKEGNVIASW